MCVWSVTLHSWVGGSDVSKEHAALILKGRMVPRHRDAARRSALSQNTFVVISYVTNKMFISRQLVSYRQVYLCPFKYLTLRLLMSYIYDISRLRVKQHTNEDARADST